MMQVRDLTTAYKGLIAIADVSLDVARARSYASSAPTAPASPRC